MKYIKAFEDFINESIETKEDKIKNLKSKIDGLNGDLLNVPRGGGGATAKKRMKAELSKATAELTLLTLKESEINESMSKLQKYVEDASKKVEKDGGNYVNITDYGTSELAGHIDIYHINTPDGIYSDKTVKLFKQLIDSMADDEIENNQDADESIDFKNDRN